MKNNTYIIAEAGVNHNGSLAIAMQLVDKACEANASSVKFQTFKAKNLVTQNIKKAEYQVANTNNNDSQFNMLKKLELSFDEFKTLFDYCNKKGIEFLSTPFDFESADFLNDLGMRVFKIPSGEITNLPLLEHIAHFNKPIILSTGMCTLEEVKDAITVIKRINNNDLTLLHCTTEYPTPYDEVNLSAIKTLKDTFNLDVGYSDHTEGIDISLCAVALGASVIEKHFTLDKSMDGPDHKASLDPTELKQLVTSIRHIEQAIGNGIKEPTKSEKKNIKIARKVIVAKTPIKNGDIFTKDNLDIKRAGVGISPMKWYELLGTVSKKDYEIDEVILWD